MLDTEKSTPTKANHRLRPLRWLINRENAFALLLCLIVIFVIIATADSSPQWIYQGF